MKESFLLKKLDVSACTGELRSILFLIGTKALELRGYFPRKFKRLQKTVKISKTCMFRGSELTV